jgi:hypothetical protein
LWNGLVWSSTHLCPEELYEDIQQAYEDGLVETGVIRLEDVEKTLERGKERVLDELSNNQRYRLITDTIKEMEWWACFRSADRLPSPSRTATSVRQPRPFAPVRQALPQQSKQKPKDKRKRKLAKASRRKNRR